MSHYNDNFNDKFYRKYIKYKLKYCQLKKYNSNNNLINIGSNNQTTDYIHNPLFGGKFTCKPDNTFTNICLEEDNGKYKTKESCINDCEGLFIRNELTKANIKHEADIFYYFIKQIIKEEKIKVYLKGGNVIGLKVLSMIYNKYKNNDKKFKECFDEFLKLDLIKDWDFSGYTGSEITKEYRDNLDKIAHKNRLVPRAKTFILYQTKKPILLEDKPLFEISILDNDTFSKLEIPLTTMKVQVHEYNLKYVFMFCKEFYMYKLKQEPFDFDVLKRLISKINVIIHPHEKGIYKVENNFDKGKLNDNLINFINEYKKYNPNLPQFLATHIEDPYRMLYRLVSKNIKKNDKIKEFLHKELKINKVEWLFDSEWITKLINTFTSNLGDKIVKIYESDYKNSKDIIVSLSKVKEFLLEISFNRIKIDYDTLQPDGLELLKNIFLKLIKSINKEDLLKIEIRDNFIDFIKFLGTKY